MALQVSPLGVIPQACETVQGYSDTLLSPLKLAGDILRHLGVSFSQSTNAFYEHVKDQKNFLALPLSISYFLNFKENASQIVDGSDRSVYQVTKTFADGFDTVNASCDFVEFLADKKVVPLNDFQTEVLGTVGTATLLGTSLTSSAIHATDMVTASQKSHEAVTPDEKQIENTRFTHSFILLTKNVAYVAAAVLGVLSITLGAVFAPWIGLACATTGVFMTVTSYFFDHLSQYQPRPAIP